MPPVAAQAQEIQATDQPILSPPAASGENGARLVLKAKAPVWVRIEDAQGKVVMAQILQGGDTYGVPDRPGLVVIARDGGLLSYLIDGKERGVLGIPGELLVGQPLDIAALQRSEQQRLEAAKPRKPTASGEKGARLVLKATAPVWVRIEDAQGSVVMTQMMRDGDTYGVPDRMGLVLIARDGGLLSYLIDGKDRGLLGVPGNILVGQPLDIAILDGRN